MKIDLSAKSKEEIIYSFATALNFPEYYEYNWDSFEEIISDLVKDDNWPDLIIISSCDLNRDIVMCLQILAQNGICVSGEFRLAVDRD